MGESKDFVNVQKLMAGEGKWTYIKEVLGWTIDTEAVTSNRCLVVDKKVVTTLMDIGEVAVFL